MYIKSKLASLTHLSRGHFFSWREDIGRRERSANTTRFCKACNVQKGREKLMMMMVMREMTIITLLLLLCK